MTPTRRRALLPSGIRGLPHLRPEAPQHWLCGFLCPGLDTRSHGPRAPTLPANGSATWSQVLGCHVCPGTPTPGVGCVGWRQAHATAGKGGGFWGRSPSGQRGRSTRSPLSTQTHPRPSNQRLRVLWRKQSWRVEGPACSRPRTGEAPAARPASELLTHRPNTQGVCPQAGRDSKLRTRCPGQQGGGRPHPWFMALVWAAVFPLAGHCPPPPARCHPQLTSSQPDLSQGQAPTWRNEKPGQVPCRFPGKSLRSPAPARHFHEAQFSPSGKGDFSLLRA